MTLELTCVIDPEFRGMLPVLNARYYVERALSNSNELAEQNEELMILEHAVRQAGRSWLPRISKHCTNGKPASIMVANCRTKIVISLVPTFGVMSLSRNGIVISLGAGFKVFKSTPVLFLMSLMAASLVGASIFLFNFRPAIFTLYVNSGIVLIEY